MVKRFLIVVGLPKSGTTFLFSEAAKRPDVFAMPVGNKEVDYFRRGKDLNSYLSLFDPNGGDTVFDASPLYLDDLDTSSANIAEALKGHDVKIVVCLRDPLERAYSHYLHDIATNQKIVGQADYSFWSAPVLSKYLYLVAPRVEQLQSMFGASNVHAFMFGQDMGAIQDVIRDFTGLEKDWALNLSSNPAPGFTSPQSFYNETADSEVRLGEKKYLLPKGQLLVVNRQYSLLRKHVHPKIGADIVQRQSMLTRQFDTGLLSENVRSRILADMEDAAALMSLDISFDRGPRQMVSKLSEELPEKFRDQLECIGSVDDGFNHVLESGFNPTSQTMISAPGEMPSLARDMARLILKHSNDPAVSETVPEIQDKILRDFGPIPYFIEARATGLIARKKYDEIAVLFKEYGNAKRLLWPISAKNFLHARGIELPDDIIEQLETAGILVR